MKEIERAVVIPDLHLGVDDSLFFNGEKQRFKNVMSWLVSNLRNSGKIDELILLGDFLDLSLAPLDVLYKNVRDVFTGLSQLDNIKSIYFFPGNHDHHFWTELVEQNVVIERIKSNEPLPPDTDKVKGKLTR